jgi:hypothetical protein
MRRVFGNILLASGEEKRAEENYKQALAATEDLVRRAPSSLYFQRQHGDSLEALGRYYLALAGRRPDLKAEARGWLQKSFAIWQDWRRRNVAMPYAGVREGQVAKLIASIDQM